jgi:VIT1/CCC1 family predicted Fe2+/Mn2+ transporter
LSDRAFQTSRDVVIGLADGAIIVSSVVAALKGADQSLESMIRAGAVTAIFGAVVLASSRYFSGKEAEKEFLQREESDSTPDAMIEKLGLSEDFKIAADSVIRKDQKVWQNKINTAVATPATAPSSNALAIGISFAAAGALSIAAFFLNESSDTSQIAAIAVSILLLICGFGKARLANRNGIAGALIQWTTGAAAIVLFYLMGRLLG